MILPAFSRAGRQKLATSETVSDKQLISLFTVRTIVGSALLEGSAFFLIVAYIIEGQPWTLAADW